MALEAGPFFALIVVARKWHRIGTVLLLFGNTIYARLTMLKTVTEPNTTATDALAFIIFRVAVLK